MGSISVIGNSGDSLAEANGHLVQAGRNNGESHGKANAEFNESWHAGSPKFPGPQLAVQRVMLLGLYSS